MKNFAGVLFVSLLCFVACQFSPDYKGGRYSCEFSSDCPDGYKCSQKICVSENSSGDCKEDKDCGAGKSCSNGKCVSSSCSLDKDCGEDYCFEGTCYKGKIGDPCNRAEQCQVGFACEEFFGKKTCRKRCSLHTDCESKEACRPDFPNNTSLCVPGCDVVKQTGCKTGQACVLYKGRGYCKIRRDKKLEGQLCKEEIDCEVHLYCRKMRGVPNIRVCAPVCNRNQGCSDLSRQCVPFPAEDAPYGFCEPNPVKVQEGGICGVGFVCEQGLICKRNPGDKYLRCHSKQP